MLVACGILETEESVRPSLKTVGFFNEARIDRFLDKQRARKRFEKRFFGGEEGQLKKRARPKGCFVFCLSWSCSYRRIFHVGSKDFIFFYRPALLLLRIMI